MKTTALVILFLPLLGVPRASAQALFLVEKQAAYVQLAAGAPAAASAVGFPAYNLSFQTPAAATVTPPGLAPVPIGYNSTYTDYELDPTFATRAGLDAAAPDGTYGIAAAGYPLVTVAVTGGLFPTAIPQVVGGTWQNGVLQVSPGASTTLTFSPFTGYGSLAGGQVAGLITLKLQSATGQDNVSLEQQAVTSAVAGLPANPAGFTTFVIPAGTLTAGLAYQATLAFDSITTLDTASIPGGVALGFYENRTSFYLGAVAGNPPSAPVITTLPGSLTAPAGGIAVFTAAYTPGNGAGLGPSATNFVWFWNGQVVYANNGKHGFGPGANLTITNVSAADAGTYVLQVVNSAGVAISPPVSLSVGAVAGAPVITAQPALPEPAVVVAATPGGTTVVLTVGATGATSYEWLLNGEPIGLLNASGTAGPTLLLAGASALDQGSYTCQVSNATGSVLSAAVVLSAVATADPGRLGNLSVLNAAGAAQVLTMGFVTGGAGTSGTQQLLIRAGGPVLTAFGIAAPLADPTLTIYPLGQTAASASNDNWGSPASNQLAVTAADSATGAFAWPNPASLDAALVAALPPGPYTAQVSGNGAGYGPVLAEIFDATAAGTYTAATPRLVNLSSLTRLTPGGLLTAGFVIGGSTAKTVLIRASGPTLAASFGLTGTVPDPAVTLHATVNGQDAVLATNAAWGGSALVATVTSQVGAFPLVAASSHDAALLVTLPPGAYTALAESVSGAGGVVLVEVYEVP